MKKKILIIGNSAKSYALAKNLSEKHDIFVAPANKTFEDFATCLDIREDSIKELLEFVMENDIDLTIPVSNKALKSGVVEIFQKNHQQIFGPASSIVEQLFDKTILKKILYKLKIPTPRFGIFEKQNLAYEYIKNQKTPFVIKTNEESSAVILTSHQTAKTLLDSYYMQKGQKVLIEDYVYGSCFSLYVISDGYTAQPIGSSILYKHSLEGNGGQLTSGMGSCVPNYKLSNKNESYIIENVVNPLLDYLNRNNTSYLGFLAIEGVLTEDGNIQILGLEPFIHDSASCAVLELIDTDLISLIEACTTGIFSDEVEEVMQKNVFATTIVLACKNKENTENIINGIEEIDDETKLTLYPNTRKNKYLELEAEYGNTLALTAFGRTVNSSTSKAYNDAQLIDFKGISYRKDICKQDYKDI